MRLESRFLCALGVLTLAGSLALAGPVAESAQQVQPLLIGAQMPDVTVKGADGKPFDLGAALAKQPTVLILYRGGW